MRREIFLPPQVIAAADEAAVRAIGRVIPLFDGFGPSAMPARNRRGGRTDFDVVVLQAFGTVEMGMHGIESVVSGRDVFDGWIDKAVFVKTDGAIHSTAMSLTSRR